MLRRLHGLFAKEFAQMLRDPVVLFLVFWLYSAELVMCTMALGFDVKNLRLGVINNDRTVVSRGLVEELTSAESWRNRPGRRAASSRLDRSDPKTGTTASES